jgi:hypothetical protein
MTGDERDLLAGITRRMEHISDQQHALARERNVLREAATQLRTGRSAEWVRAHLREAGVVSGRMGMAVSI